MSGGKQSYGLNFRILGLRAASGSFLRMMFLLKSIETFFQLSSLKVICLSGSKRCHEQHYADWQLMVPYTFSLFSRSVVCMASVVGWA